MGSDQQALMTEDEEKDLCPEQQIAAGERHDAHVQALERSQAS